jgi:hypothetical protein
MIAAMKGGDIGGRRTRHFGEHHAEDGDDLRQAAANVANQRQRQFGNPGDDVGGTHQFADQKEERNGEQRFAVDPVEHLLDDRRHRNVGEGGAHQDARHQRERDRHAHIAEDQEQHGHQT